MGWEVESGEGRPWVGLGLGWEKGKLGRLGGRREGWLLCWVALPGFSLLLADWALASLTMSVCALLSQNVESYDRDSGLVTFRGFSAISGDIDEL